MKFKLTQAEWDALPETTKLLYVRQADGTYQLPLTDMPDTGALERARDRERDAAAQLRLDNANLQTEVTNLRSSTPRDVQTLTRAHNEALETIKRENESVLIDLRGQVERGLMSNAARTIAESVTGSKENASIMLPHIESRIAVEWKDNKATVKIKNSDGSLGNVLDSSNSKNLEKEFVDDTRFASVVVKSRASGGGAAAQTNTGQTGGAGADTGAKKYGDLSSDQRNNLYLTNKPEFDRLLKEHEEEQKRAPRPRLKVNA